MNEIKDLGSILRSLISDLHIQDKLDQYKIFNHWEEIVGKEIAKNAKPERIKDMTLYLLCRSPIWANELNLLSQSILAKINAFAGKDLIKDIKVKSKY
jgi:predicted nucleic acid-binding Zn ribbon protein